MFKLSFYVPESHLDVVKQVLFNVGAGKTGNYDSCCWQVLGQGQFRPLSGSAPFIGQQGVVETVNEYKVEMVCESHYLQQAIIQLKQAHPYEEPAYEVIKLEESF